MKGKSRWSLLAVGLTTLLVSCYNGQVTESDIVNRVNEIYGKVAEVYESQPDRGMLDSLYCSNDWKTLVKIVEDTDIEGNELGFFDADYWVMGQDWQDLSVDSVVVEQLAEREALASLNLHNCGQITRVRLQMVNENEAWKIDNFIDVTNGLDWKANMNDYVETAALMLQTDSIGLVKEDANVEVSLHADYPTGGATAVVVDSIRRYIAETIQGDVRLAGEPEQLLTSAYKKVYEDMKAERDELLEDVSDVPPFSIYCEIKKGTDTKKYVSYLTTYGEYQGGAHGTNYGTGVTFDKATGRQMGWNMLKDTDKPEFRKMIKEGLRQYFQSYDADVSTDELLKDFLYTDADIDNLPLPAWAPYLTEEGMLFSYQQYEIAAYAAGIPAFVISYDQLKPYLTEAGAALIKEK